jgi:hypothetical protein
MPSKVNEPYGLLSRTVGMQPDPIGAPLVEASFFLYGLYVFN